MALFKSFSDSMNSQKRALKWQAQAAGAVFLSESYFACSRADSLLANRVLFC